MTGLCLIAAVLPENCNRLQWVGLRQASLQIASRKAASEIPTPGSGQSPLSAL